MSRPGVLTGLWLFAQVAAVAGAVFLAGAVYAAGVPIVLALIVPALLAGAFARSATRWLMPRIAAG